MFNFEIFVSSAANPDDQTQMFLGDYQNKNQFIAAAKSFIFDATSETDPEIRYEFDEDTVFDGTGLITENSIDEKAWEYLSLEIEEVIERTLAFAMAFPNEGANVSEIRELAEERSFGKHSEITDFGYAFLDKKGFMENLPKIIEENIDINTISLGLMMTHTVYNDWYFANKEQDGWHLSGSNG